MSKAMILSAVLVPAVAGVFTVAVAGESSVPAAAPPAAADAVSRASAVEIHDRANLLPQTGGFEAIRPSPIWESTPGAPLTAPLTLDQGVVYAACGPHLLAIDARTGQTLWQSPEVSPGLRPSIPRIVGSNASLTSAPVVAGPIVCVVAAHRVLHAFDLKTGKHVWSQLHLAETMGTPAGGRELVVVAGPDTLFGIQSASGKLLWKFLIPAGIVGAPLWPPAIPGHPESLYLTTNDGLILALEITGKAPREVWQIDVGDTPTTGPALGPGDTLYLGAAGQLLAFDARTRARKWSYVTAGPGEQALARQFLISTSNGLPAHAAPAEPIIVKIVAVNPEFGPGVKLENPENSWGDPGAEQSGDSGPGARVVNPGAPVPVIEGGVAYLSVGRKLHAVDTATGMVRWVFEPQFPKSMDGTSDPPTISAWRLRLKLSAARLDGPLLAPGLSAPLLAGQTIYVGSPWGILAVDRQTGLPPWRYLTETAVVGRPILLTDSVVFGQGVDSAVLPVAVEQWLRGSVPAFPGRGESRGSAAPVHAVMAVPIPTKHSVVPSE